MVWSHMVTLGLMLLRALCKKSGTQSAKTLYSYTVKFLNFQTPENCAKTYLKFKQRGQIKVFRQKDANGTVNSEDPDQTCSLGLHCLSRPICPKT